jgi:predicted dehydrogenase
VKGTPFELVRHLILYDFGIHWFDLVLCLMHPRQPSRIYASLSRSPGQTIKPALLGQAIIEFDEGQASLVFDGDTHCGFVDTTIVTGTKGTLASTGPDHRHQEVTLYTSEGYAKPSLTGCWFPDGFHGTMGELLCSIEEAREPTINARDNLKSLALCFAATASADTHQPVIPGTVRRID